MGDIQFIREVKFFTRNASTEKDPEPTHARCVVRTNCYGHSIGFFQRLAAAVKEDFPELSYEDMEVVHYGGSIIKRIYGIEFTVTNIDHPVVAGPLGRYTKVRELEPTL